MVRGDSRVSHDLLTRLSPENGDDNLNLMASLLCCCNPLGGVGSVFAAGSCLAPAKEFCGRTLALLLWMFGWMLCTLKGAPPSHVRRMMRHKHYGTTEIYVEKVQRLFEGAEDAVMQI